ncbi:MAG: putative Ig domain-containing protein [Candidatus Omnitrophota bacterium]
MRKTSVTAVLAAVVVSFLFGCLKEAGAAVINVPTQYATIQAAINAAYPNDIILVAQGLYRENLDIAKPLTLKSVTGAPESTCISGLDVSKPAVKVHDVVGNIAISNPRVTIAGFKITNGGGGQVGWGGILVGNVDDIGIYNNVITANRAYAPGIYLGSGTKKFDIRRNTITRNNASFGGLQVDTCVDASGAIANNVIAFNNGMSLGGGVYLNTNGRNLLKVTLTNNTIAYNTSSGTVGAGIYAYDTRSLLDYRLKNNIIWGNTTSSYTTYPEARNVCGVSLHNTLQTYNDVEGIKGVGMPVFTNIDADPRFASSANLHLSAGSPCLDAGDPSDDNSNEPVPSGGNIDIGAFGNTPGAGVNVNVGPIISPIADMQIKAGALFEFAIPATDSNGDTISYAMYQAGDIDHNGILTPVDALSIANIVGAKVGSLNWNAEADLYRNSAASNGVITGDDYSAALNLINLGRTMLPAGLSVNQNGQLSWIPTTTQVGTYAVTVVASDGKFKDARMFSITVTK